MPKAQPLQPELPLWSSYDQSPPVGDARRIVLGDRVVSYVLKRSERRTIGLVVDRSGLRVGAPRRATQKEVDALILKHADWVLAKLAEWVGRELRPRIRVADGASFPLLGEPARVAVSRGSNRCTWTVQGIHLAAREGARLDALLEKALRERARQLFGERMACFAERMRLPLPALSLSSARTRWGSCNRQTGIRLNWRLIHCAPHLIDYVVVHELAHLRYMDHSARFWCVVESVLPDYRDARAELRALSERLPEFD